jgi:hypothetical protein
MIKLESPQNGFFRVCDCFFCGLALPRLQCPRSMTDELGIQSPFFPGFSVNVVSLEQSKMNLFAYHGTSKNV